MGFSELVGEAKVIAVYCNQWGDTGKGKFSDYFAREWADVIARGTGGNNAGHTVVVGDKERVFHLLPAGIVYDSLGKVNILGRGMVIDPAVLINEIKELEEEGISYANLMISRDAHVIMEYHIAQDKAKYSSQNNCGIGSTGRGIGPCYTDKVARRGIRMFEFLDSELLRKKLEKISTFYSDLEINVEEIIKETRPLAEKLAPFVKDTDEAMHGFLKEGKKILIEGAQGLLLSIEHGTFPYVTSSDCSLNGMASGVGICASQIDLPLGIVKFPFMTRVGGGPFPTELGGTQSEEYCSNDGHEKNEEKEFYGAENVWDLISSEDQFKQGVGIRIAAGEYGATTGRPRRVGWTDAVAAKYATQKNGPLIILTKPDCLGGSSSFKICYGYEGSEGKGKSSFQTDENFLRSIKPVYKHYSGYGDISRIREYDDLPESLREAISDFEEFTGSRVVCVSVGAERDATILR